MKVVIVVEMMVLLLIIVYIREMVRLLAKILRGVERNVKS